MLTIRLQRAGKRNHSHFSVVLAEKAFSVSKKIAEVLGSYNPHSKELVLKNQDRLNSLIAQRIEMSPTVHNLLVTKGILKAEKVKAFNVPKKKEEAPKVENVEVKAEDAVSTEQVTEEVKPTEEAQVTEEAKA